ncbi:MAG: hypothetical protein QME78_00170 [Thermodesulfobacteriota bacterium]|nr:hypothetical protein [Thermodesulfobacteriota bacterium]
MKWREFLIDPSSGQLSMSRLCYGIIAASLLVFAGGLLWQGKAEALVDLLKTALITTAGLYGANSVAGAVARRGKPSASPPKSKTPHELIAPPNT